LLLINFIESGKSIYNNFGIGKMAYNFNPRERQRRTMKFD